MQKTVIFFFAYVLSLNFSYCQSITIGYLGNNLWNPGVELTYSKKIKSQQFAAELSYYFDPDSHSAILANLGVQKVKRKWSLGASPLGIYRSFLINSYDVLENGKIESPSSFKGNFYYAPSVSLNRHHYQKFKSKFQIVLLTPYNSSVMPIFNFGLAYQIFTKSDKESR